MQKYSLKVFRQIFTHLQAKGEKLKCCYKEDIIQANIQVHKYSNHLKLKCCTAVSQVSGRHREKCVSFHSSQMICNYKGAE